MAETKKYDEKLKKLIFSLCATPSISGFEGRSHDYIRSTFSGDFDEIVTDGVGNCTLIKRCGKENAPRALVDAHMDEIGMIVTDTCEGGFVKIAPLGGLDVSIMQAADVIIYGKQAIRGVICSTPPHLKKDDKLPEPQDLLVDTGLSKAELDDISPIGTPVGFAPVYGELLGGKICGKSFDDKACAACAIYAVANTPKEELCADVYVLLSAMEETNRRGGVIAAAFAADPDYAMIIDVNLARVPDTKDYETVPMDKGISLSASAGTHRVLTELTAKLCEEKEIPHCIVAAPSSTGTNAVSVNLVGLGIPTVDVGLPLACMHTYNEIISLADCESLCRLVHSFVTSEDIAKKMKQEEGLLL